MCSIKQLKSADKLPILNFLQSSDSLTIQLTNGKNKLTYQMSDNFFHLPEKSYDHFTDKLLYYKNDLLYSATSNFYGTPTLEELIRKHYAEKSTLEIKDIIEAYRNTMSSTIQTIESIFKVNQPIIKLLSSGKYVLSLRNIFPTFGGKAIYSDFADSYLTASVDRYPNWVDYQNMLEPIDAFTAFMLPTQTENAYSSATLDFYRSRDFLGRGLILHLSGFLGCLLDGHHKAKVAYERKEPLECLVIEPFFEGNEFRGLSGDSIQYKNIPTIDEFYFLNSYIKRYKITSTYELYCSIEKNRTQREQLSYQEMEELIITLYLLEPDSLTELYPSLCKKFDYKDLKTNYFNYLTSLNRSEMIENLCLDYLINDDYENKVITKICEDYFR